MQFHWHLLDGERFKDRDQALLLAIFVFCAPST